jgi:CHC2 zinc finger
VTIGLLAIACQHGAKLKRCGDEWTGSCPRCGGRDRSSVNPSRGLWNCRGCGFGGDTIALVRHVAGAAEGERNGAGQIGEREALAGLIEAAAAAGLTEREAIITIRSGLRRTST